MPAVCVLCMVRVLSAEYRAFACNGSHSVCVVYMLVMVCRVCVVDVVMYVVVVVCMVFVVDQCSSPIVNIGGPGLIRG